MDWLVDAPKVELHVHLEGSTTPECYLELARRNKVELPFRTIEEGKAYFKYKNLVAFLAVYRTCTTAITQPKDFFLLIEEFARSRAKENIRYSEFFISLGLHVLHEIDPEDILEVVAKACRNAEIKYNIKLRCIPDVSRDVDIGIALDCLKAVIRKRSEYIIGFGIGGSERVDTKKFAGLFITAKDQGLRIVAHAGEWKGTQVIWDAIKALGAERIGHGITAITDKQLMKFLITTQIPIEVSPTSNVCVGLIDKFEDHPIFEMIERGLNVTVHSDDPTMFNTTLAKELQKVGAKIGTEAIIRIMYRNINASFMPIAEKKVQFDELSGYLVRYQIKP